MIIAIDGSAASGKGTLAKRLAKHFGLSHLDTGALYRAVGLQLLNGGKNPENIDHNQCVKSCFGLDITLTTSPLIRSEKVAEMASVVAAIPAVRAALLDLQRQFAAAPPDPNGAVLDGRDIGTMVLPNADIKFFIDADIHTRADRRTKELLQSGQSVMFRDVLIDMQERDTRDRSRSASPLRPADDAIIIDTSEMDAESVMAFALSHITACCG
jgi:cytidylate kinase